MLETKSRLNEAIAPAAALTFQLRKAYTRKDNLSTDNFSHLYDFVGFPQMSHQLLELPCIRLQKEESISIPLV